MKRLFYLFGLFLIILPSYSQENNSEAKAQINKIKKSSDYLYGEATLSSPEEALNLAKEILGKEIDIWIQEKKKLKTSNNIVIKNISEVSQEMTLPRGNMHRAFVFVKKSDIIPSENAVVVNTNEKKDINLNTPDKGTQDNSNLPVTNAVLEKIASISDFNQLKNCLTSLKREGKISTYEKYSSITNPADYYLIIYNQQGRIEAVLSPESENRINLKTNKADSIKNYKGRGAIGFKL